MKADEVLARVTLPDGKEMTLVRWDRHIGIEVGGRPLMTSHDHGSEDELGATVGEAVRGIARPRVLIGGLGLGYTLRAALDLLPATARVDVAELVPEVVAWNRGAQGKLAKRPLDDKRVKVLIEDVSEVIKRSTGYDAILLDVDNGPDGLIRAANDRLYSRAGLEAAKAALKPGGILAIWSAAPDPAFKRRLTEAGFTVDEAMVRGRSNGKGAHHTIWFARI